VAHVERPPLEGATVVRTLESRDLTTASSGAIEVWCEGAGIQEMVISAGEPWTYLQYRAEGHVMARIQEQLCEVPVLAREDIFGEDLPQPIVQWWVEVLYADSSSQGWLLVNEEVQFSRRRF
ncbi:MAG: hypothetical protein R3284_06510, partial [Rubricoccaceae bacterium]|nr:hypothetical protein [Rubricoccaceae bacterium]